MKNIRMKLGGVIYVVLTVLMCSSTAIAKKATTLDARFEAIQTENAQFDKNSRQQKFRHNYVRLADKWVAFARDNPKSQKAPEALNNAARLYERLAKFSHLAKDRETALALFQQAKPPRVESKPSDNLAKILAKHKDVPAPAGVAPAVANVAVAKEAIQQITKVDVTEQKEGVVLHVKSSGQLSSKQGIIKKSNGQPLRVFFDLSPAQVDKGLLEPVAAGQGSVLRVRTGQFSEDTVRIVIELKESVPVQLQTDGPAGEALADAKPEPAVMNAAPTVISSPSKPDTIKATRQPLRVIKPELAFRKIVLDPGHGGDDPGAIGKTGLREKDVTLAVARRVKGLLEKQMPGVKVYMTRDTDRTVQLAERTQYANDLQADLFISIHVNAAENESAQGIETYYLNIAHDRYAVRLAARENAMSESQISNLEFILADLAMKSNVSDSIRLGEAVQGSMCSYLQQDWQDIKDLGLKHALFYVLLGARMPAILVETSFISHRQDEKRLRTEKYRDALAEGLVKGIRRYAEQKEAMYTPKS